MFGETDVLFSFKAGGNMSEATYSRASSATYRLRTGALSTASSTGVTRLQWYDVDDDGGWEQPALLIEGSRTNSLVQSEAFNSTLWTKSGLTVGANAATAPDNSTTADKIAESTSTGATTHSLSQASTGAADDTLQSYSVFGKAGTRKWLAIRTLTNADSSAYSYFNLLTGAKGTESTTHTASIEAYQDGFYRAAVAWDSSTGTADAGSAVFLASTDGTVSYVGSTSNYLYLWGAQYEKDGAFPTSYIPTSTAAVTRGADSLTFPLRFGVQDLTVYVKLIRPAYADESGNISVSPGLFDIGIGNPRLLAYFQSNARNVQALISDADGTQINIAGAVPSGDPLECAIQYRNLKSDPQVRIDMGSGFGSWTSTGSVDPFYAFGSTAMRVGKVDNELFAGLQAIKIARGLKTLSVMRDMRTAYGG